VKQTGSLGGLKLQAVCREKSRGDGEKRSGRDVVKRRGRWDIYTLGRQFSYG